MQDQEQQAPSKNSVDRIEQDRIILHADGKFPKRLIIVEASQQREYTLRKTRNGKYLLN